MDEQRVSSVPDATLATLVTAYIRSAALAADQPFDRKAIARLAATVEQQAHELHEAVG